MNRVSVALALGAIAIVAVQCHEITQGKADQRATLKQLEATQLDKRRWQAKYSIASIDAQKKDTVYRVARARVDTLRDSLVITDTLSVIRYVAAADSALQACTELANSCQVFRLTADSSLAAERKVNDALRQYAESVKPSLVQRNWWAVGILAALGGAFVRGK